MSWYKSTIFSKVSTPMSFGVPSGCKGTLKLPLLSEQFEKMTKKQQKSGRHFWRMHLTGNFCESSDWDKKIGDSWRYLWFGKKILEYSGHILATNFDLKIFFRRTKWCFSAFFLFFAYIFFSEIAVCTAFYVSWLVNVVKLEINHEWIQKGKTKRDESNILVRINSQ